MVFLGLDFISNIVCKLLYLKKFTTGKLKSL